MGFLNKQGQINQLLAWNFKIACIINFLINVIKWQLKRNFHIMLTEHQPNFFLTFKLGNQDLLNNLRKIQHQFVGRNKEFKAFMEPVGKA